MENGAGLILVQQGVFWHIHDVFSINPPPRPRVTSGCHLFCAPCRVLHAPVKVWTNEPHRHVNEPPHLQRTGFDVRSSPPPSMKGSPDHQDDLHKDRRSFLLSWTNTSLFSMIPRPLLQHRIYILWLAARLVIDGQCL